MARTPSPSNDDTAVESDANKDTAAEKPGPGTARTKRLVTGAAIGIGSAALVAALLYANRSRKQDKS